MLRWSCHNSKSPKPCYIHPALLGLRDMTSSHSGQLGWRQGMDRLPVSVAVQWVLFQAVESGPLQPKLRAQVPVCSEHGCFLYP